MIKRKSILLLSGGLDSCTLLAYLVNQERKNVLAIVFDYGQRLAKEIQIAVEFANSYNQKSFVIKLPFDAIGKSCSILNADIPIEKNRTKSQISLGGTPSSYVPFRNGIFLAYAVAIGEAMSIGEIYCGGNGLNSGNYWDDTKEFADAFQAAAKIGTSPSYSPKISFPFSGNTKAEIAKIGFWEGVDYTKTWSCYDNRVFHCGVCDSCVQRAEALSAINCNIHGEKTK